MRRRAHGEIDVGFSDAEVAKERRGETLVVMLSSVHDELLESSRVGRSIHRRKLGKIGPSANDVEEFGSFHRAVQFPPSVVRVVSSAERNARAAPIMERFRELAKQNSAACRLSGWAPNPSLNSRSPGFSSLTPPRLRISTPSSLSILAASTITRRAPPNFIPVGFVPIVCE